MRFLRACLLAVVFGLQLAGQAVADVPLWLADGTYDMYGEQDRVLRPWTPVAIGRQRITVWGREMTWNADSILPASIKSQGEELLAQPMRLTVMRGGQERAVPLQHFRITEHKKSRATVVAKGQAAGIAAEATMTAEYDGFLWVTLRLDAQEPDTGIGAVRIVASLPARIATLYQTFSRPLAGWIGEEPIDLPWRASTTDPIANFYHWVGNEDRGLGFTYTSLEGWAPASEDAFCTIRREHDKVIYTANVVEKPVRLAGRLFQFGIQATPIKPLPPDYHSMLSTAWQWEEWAPWQQVPQNIDTLVIWPPGYMRGLNDPYHINAEALAETVRLCHERGVGVLFTGCPQKISPLSDEFEAWRDEWLNLPESVLDWEGTPHYQNCGRSYTLRKWLYYGWAKAVVERFGLEGIYFDGWQAGTMACHNERHGCGWVDEEGQRHLTVPVLEGREFNQRMAAFLEDHVTGRLGVPETAPDRGDFPIYHYRLHSWEFVPSVMGFATSWLTGEFAAYPLKGVGTLDPQGTFGKALGLGLFRARCLSTNWGVPNFFHVVMWEHGEHPKRSQQTVMAYAWLLPHGVPLGETRYMNRHVVAKVSRAMMDFGTRRATFTPCWRPNTYVRVEQPRAREVVAATWAHPARKQVLIVVSNLQVSRPETVTLRWTASWLPRLTNALTGEAVPMRGSRFTARLKPETFVLFRAQG